MVEFVSWLKDWSALVVAGAALLVTLVTARRAVRKDRAFWVLSEDHTRKEDRAHYWVATMVNYGHGSAGDVRLYLFDQLRPEGKLQAKARTVGLGEEVRASVELDDLSNQTLGTMRLVLRWRQAPNFEKEREQVFPFPMAHKHDHNAA